MTKINFAGGSPANLELPHNNDGYRYAQPILRLLRAAQPGSVWLDVAEAFQAAIPTPVRGLLQELNRRMG